MDTSGTESYEGCLQTQSKHLPPQLALKLILVRLQSFQTSKEVYGLRNFTYTNGKSCPKIRLFKWHFFVEPVA